MKYMILSALVLTGALVVGAYAQVMRQQGTPPSGSVTVVAQGTTTSYQIQVVEVSDEQGVTQPVLQLSR